MERFIDIFQHKQELRNNGKILTINNYKQSYISVWIEVLVDSLPKFCFDGNMDIQQWLFSHCIFT